MGEAANLVTTTSSVAVLTTFMSIELELYTRSNRLNWMSDDGQQIERKLFVTSMVSIARMQSASITRATDD